jgi:1,4-dihydroxy-2-naphthoate octaprenyltransferase
MNEHENKPLTKWQVWWLAARPKTLPAAVSGVVAGTALAVRDGQFRLGPALAALCVGLLLQIGSNLANDVFDYERGADTAARLGPLRVTQAGLLSPAQVKAGMAVVFGLAALLGVYLTWQAGWVVLLIGLAAIFSAILYTGGPFAYGYYGLGDLFVFLFFGLAAVAGTYYVQAETVSQAAWWTCVPIGLLVVNILVVNNLRDIENDRSVGKHTLAVRLGVRGTRVQYTIFLAVAYLIIPILALSGVLPWTAILTWSSLRLAIPLLLVVWRAQGRSLNVVLAGSGQLAFFFSVAFLVGMIIS